MKKPLLTTLALTAILALTLSACKDDEGTLLSLSETQLEFAANDTAVKQVTVTTDAPEWKVTSDKDWIKTSVEGNVLSVSADYNSLAEDRVGAIVITALDATASIAVVQRARVLPTEIKIFYDRAGGAFNKLSSGGRYAIGYFTDAYGFYYDLATGNMTDIWGLTGTVEYNMPMDDCETADISDNGVMVGLFRTPELVIYHKDENGDQIYDDQGNPLITNPSIPGMYSGGAWVQLERRDDLVPLVGSRMDGWATSITGDGRYAVGTVHMPGGSGFGLVVPCMWDLSTGKLKEQYDCPTSGQGGNAYSCSDDGSKVVGWVDNGDFVRHAAVWIDGKLTTLTDPSEMKTISPNGEHFGGDCNGMPIWWTAQGGTKELPIHPSMIGGSVCGIADDGTTIGYSYDQFGTSRLPFVVTPEGKFYDLVDYLKEVYGYTAPDDLLPSELVGVVDLSGYLFIPIDISADGKVICGYTAAFEPWILTLGEPVQK